MSGTNGRQCRPLKNVSRARNPLIILSISAIFLQIRNTLRLRLNLGRVCVARSEKDLFNKLCNACIDVFGRYALRPSFHCVTSRFII